MRWRGPTVRSVVWNRRVRQARTDFEYGVITPPLSLVVERTWAVGLFEANHDAPAANQINEVQGFFLCRISRRLHK